MDLVINMDSSTVVLYMKMDVPPWNVRNRIRAVKEAIGRLRSCILDHCYRESNSLADELANVVTNDRVAELDVTVLSDKCNEIVE